MSITLDGFPEAVLRQDGKEYMMGIDEAGRGPTLGPMVYGSAFCAVEDEERVKKMGFMDSKQLTEAKREQLWAELQQCGFIGWRIRVLDAKEISEGMLRRHQKYNLNAMSHDAAIGLVQGVLAPVQFLVFLISLVLVLRTLTTGEGAFAADLSVIAKTFVFSIPSSITLSFSFSSIIIST